MPQLQPGPHLYFDAIGNPPVPVVLKLVDKHHLGVFFEGRGDYDLVDEVSGRFEPAAKESAPARWPGRN